MRRVARRRPVAYCYRYHPFEPVAAAVHDVDVSMLLCVVRRYVPLVGERDEGCVLRRGGLGAEFRH
jgi:hypothetical protein